MKLIEILDSKIIIPWEFKKQDHFYFERAKEEKSGRGEGWRNVRRVPIIIAPLHLKQYGEFIVYNGYRKKTSSINNWNPPTCNDSRK